MNKRLLIILSVISVCAISTIRADDFEHHRGHMGYGYDVGRMMQAREKARKDSVKFFKDEFDRYEEEHANMQPWHVEYQAYENEKAQIAREIDQREASLRDLKEKMNRDIVGDSEHAVRAAEANQTRYEARYNNGKAQITTDKKKINEIESKMSRLLSKMGRNKGEGIGGYTESTKDFQARRKKIADKMKEAESNIAKLENTSQMGVAFARGVAGKDWEAIQDLNIHGLKDGLYAGFVFKGARVIGDKVEETMKNEVSGIWDTLVVGPLKVVKKGVKRVWNNIFHGGRQPFDVRRLQAWKSEVLDGVMNGLEKRAKEAERNQCSGREAKMRSMMGESFMQTDQQAPLNNGKKEMVNGKEDLSPHEKDRRDYLSSLDEEYPGIDPEKDTQWYRMAQGYARDLERIRRRIQAHKRYYLKAARRYDSDESDIVAIATRIQDILAILREKIILPSESLKDLAIGDNKLFLPQIYKDIEKRFDLLIDAIVYFHGIRGVDKKSTTSSSDANGGRKRKNYDYPGMGF